MFNKDYVLTQLREGRDYEEIMKEISDVLNEASKEFDAEQQKSSERQNKIDDMQDILDLVHDYCINYYGTSNKKIDQIHNVFDSEDAEKCVDFIDSCLEISNSLTDLSGLLNLGNSKTKDNIEVTIDTTDFDKTFSNFLKFLK